MERAVDDFEVAPDTNRGVSSYSLRLCKLQPVKPHIRFRRIGAVTLRGAGGAG